MHTRGLTEVVPCGGEEGPVPLAPAVITWHHLDLKLLLSSGVLRAISSSSREGVRTHLEYSVRLTMLPKFGNKKAVGLVLKEEDEAKLQCLTYVVAASKDLASRCMQASCWCFIKEK